MECQPGGAHRLFSRSTQFTQVDTNTRRRTIQHPRTLQLDTPNHFAHNPMHLSILHHGHVRSLHIHLPQPRLHSTTISRGFRSLTMWRLLRLLLLLLLLILVLSRSLPMWRLLRLFLLLLLLILLLLSPLLLLLLLLLLFLFLLLLLLLLWKWRRENLQNL